jgi:hypothetical protein
MSLVLYEAWQATACYVIAPTHVDPCPAVQP